LFLKYFYLTLKSTASISTAKKRLKLKGFKVF
jgi:hypothetical protein